jgi:RNA polymerase sigma factor (sigma-70 family)
MTSAGHDEAIWTVFQKGDPQAFAELYRRYFTTLFRYGMRITCNRDLVKDCLHDVFVDLWKNRENLCAPHCVKAYLLSATQRKIIRQVDRLRARQIRIDNLSRPTADSCLEDDLIQHQTELEQRHSVNKALDVLTKRQRQAVYLKFYNNLSYKEAAAIMSISVDAIYNLISKSINLLHAEFVTQRGAVVGNSYQNRV